MSTDEMGRIDALKLAGLKTGSIRIGLIADTHIPRDAKSLPPHVEYAFRGVDLILHAGDIYVPDVLDELETVAPVLACEGNGDRYFPEDRRVKRSQVLNVAGMDIGLTHWIGGFDSLQCPLEKMVERLFGQHVDIVVSGDTHVAMIEKHNGILLVNPGSPTVPEGRFELGTVALLEITGGSAQARIVHLNEVPLPLHWESVYGRRENV